ncbi:hypothetical protein [Aestuariivivens sediminis]|uniref:hypothetical protein n=1 Tax=Aestuariivivens sediminis TaxID=2913557 RepID=UPI001F566CB7|nr:hypothetical protein [Aestuariivivens sediminis]
MDLEFAEYYIDFNGSEYVLIKDEKNMLTPAGNLIKHHNRRLIEHIMFELECEIELDITQLSTYTLYSAMVDLLQGNCHQGNLFTIENFRTGILNDPVLKACAGPEKIQQFKKWADLFSDLELLGLDYPDIVQIPDIDTIEDWIKGNGKEYEDSIDKIVNHYYAEFNLLSDCQKTVVLHSANLHASLVYGILLASKKCTEINYVAAILAGQCLLPNIFGDINTEDYKEAFEEIKSDAHIFSNFIDCCLTPDEGLNEFIKAKIPAWAFLPDGSKTSLIEGLSKIHEASSSDYSSYVMLMGKAIEIALKKNVFDEFQIRSKYNFKEQKDVKLFIESNEVIKNLARYLVKEPHFIELGSMLFILEKNGGKTASRNEVLIKFFEFVKEELNKVKILDKEWIKLANHLKDHRNRASHSERYSQEQAQEVKEIALQLLEAF